MAVTKGTGRTLQIIIDGIPVENLAQWSAERDTTFDIGPFISEIRYSRFESSVMRVELQTVRNTTLAFDVPANKVLQTEDTIYINGPLRELFPSLFIDKDLLDWQLAYITFIGLPEYKKFELFRDDDVFATNIAEAYRSGYVKGYALGHTTGESKGYTKGRKDETDDQKQQHQRKKYK